MGWRGEETAKRTTEVERLKGEWNGCVESVVVTEIHG
jgi:hypothetical protein